MPISAGLDTSVQSPLSHATPGNAHTHVIMLYLYLIATHPSSRQCIVHQPHQYLFPVIFLFFILQHSYHSYLYYHRWFLKFIDFLTKTYFCNQI